MSKTMKTINRIINERAAISPNNEVAVEKKQQELFNALGDNEDGVIEILNTTNGKMLKYFSEIFEDIYRKFPTEKMWNTLEELEKRII